VAGARVGESIRVLIIDDHQTVLWGLERLIESDRPRLELAGKATSATAALSQLEATRPHVILVDLDLGDESGLDAIPALIEHSDARVLVLTGIRDTTLHEAALLAGASGVIGKQAPPADILKAIQKVHDGELWADRQTTQRLLASITRRPQIPAHDPEGDKIRALTPRERDIVRKLSSTPGLSLKSVADKLGITERTLRNHLTSIYEKLGVSGRLELYVYATDHGLAK
jgi:DNA-binding NarL/FixJ family response regulator